MRARFVTAWNNATPISYQNESFPEQDANTPWVYFEVLQTASDIRGFGKPGSQSWLTLGLIVIHVFAPKGYGLPDHLALANAAGEIFRAQTFYVNDPAKVLCRAPSVQGGASDADDGNWFVLSVSIPFEFYFQA